MTYGKSSHVCARRARIRSPSNGLGMRPRASTGLPAGCRYGTDLIPSAHTLHCDQVLIFATETCRLLDPSDINQRSFEARVFHVGLRYSAPSFTSSPQVLSRNSLAATP